MITDKDISKLNTIFTTKNEIKSNHDAVMDKLDVIAKELQDFRDEQTLHQGQHDDINEQLDRIDKKLGFNPL